MDLLDTKVINEEKTMVNHLWTGNSPSRFWQPRDAIDPQAWQRAIETALILSTDFLGAATFDQVLLDVLGEGRFGQDHWKLSMINRLYWALKPYLPCALIRAARSVIHRLERHIAKDYWPIDDRFRSFLWEIMRQYLLISGISELEIRSFWPDQKRFAVVLTHDVESPQGMTFISKVAELEEKYGFRSSFNIVGDQVPNLLNGLIEIKERGFEIGIHGWHHDWTSFASEEKFMDSARKINRQMEFLGAVGHRSPLNLRNPEWMQALDADYDLSFFDTDPFEPIPGGVMSIWPFSMGKIIELPATLVQDNTLINLLGEDTERVWLDKVAYIQRYYGMALLNSHPDYLQDQTVWKVYEGFLAHLQSTASLWTGLPRDAAAWWRSRLGLPGAAPFPEAGYLTVSLKAGHLMIEAS